MMTPVAVVRAHVRMMPRLEAEESLLVAQRVALGSGSYKKDDARRLTHRWTNQARGPRISESAAAVNPRELAGMGIGFRRRPKGT